jgi:sulfatase modifying factor 1
MAGGVQPTSSGTSDMVPIAGGEFVMGSSRFYPEEQPEVVVPVADFWIDRCPVTNAEFAAFVAATDYVTVAERPLDPDDYPGASPVLLQPGGLVFQRTANRVPLDDVTRWWTYRPGASWQSPLAVPTDPTALADHPVVQVAYEDAEAYALWRGVRLPAEAEWELAARGGLDAADYCWGDEPYPDGRQLANTWQGEFPWQNLALDGYESTSPVGAFPANGYGLHDMAGNVWEWTNTWWQDHHQSADQCCTPAIDRAGAENSRAAGETFGRKVIKGGSHLCAPNYCLRFRPAARQPEAVDTSTCHLGFRCAADATGPPGLP